MTVTVTLKDGDSDKYLRYGDTYVRRGDGTLEVIRDGAKEPHSYAPGVWTEVHGDEMHVKRSRFTNLFKRKGTESPQP